MIIIDNDNCPKNTFPDFLGGGRGRGACALLPLSYVYEFSENLFIYFS